MINLSLILPVYNQADHIKQTFDEIHKAIQKLSVEFECILVENGSTDLSPSYVEQLAKTYTHTKAIHTKKGYGSAVLSGIAASHGTYICYMPSDGQIDLHVLPLLWKETKKHAWTMVKVKRITRESWIRTMTSSFFSYLTSLLFGIPRIDINGSPRIVFKKDIELLHLHSMDSFIDAEFAVKAYRRAWTIKEIPMHTLARAGGTSTRSWRTYAEFFKNMGMFFINQK